MMDELLLLMSWEDGKLVTKPFEEPKEKMNCLFELFFGTVFHGTGENLHKVASYNKHMVHK